MSQESVYAIADEIVRRMGASNASDEIIDIPTACKVLRCKIATFKKLAKQYPEIRKSRGRYYRAKCETLARIRRSRKASA